MIRVIQSAWDAAPVENNVAEEVELRHIAAAVVVQACLEPETSGVALSRDPGLGTRGYVGYQLVRGFGGGVEGGAVEEGVIGALRCERTRPHPDAPSGLVPREALAELRRIVLGIERFFDEVIEPGRGHAVDVELARVRGGWRVVQARVVQLGEDPHAPPAA